MKSSESGAAGSGRLHRRVDNRTAPFAKLLGKLDDQDRVLRRQANQHHETDLAIQIVLKSPRPLRRQRPEHAERNASRTMNGRMSDSCCAASVR